MATSDVGSDKGPEPGDVAQSRGIWTEAMMEMNDDVYYYIRWRLTKARRGDGEYGRLYEGAEGRNSRGTHGHSLH